MTLSVAHLRDPEAVLVRDGRVENRDELSSAPQDAGREPVLRTDAERIGFNA